MRQRKVSGAGWEKDVDVGEEGQEGSRVVDRRQGTSPDCLCPYSVC